MQPDAQPIACIRVQTAARMQAVFVQQRKQTASVLQSPLSCIRAPCSAVQLLTHTQTF